MTDESASTAAADAADTEIAETALDREPDAPAALAWSEIEDHQPARRRGNGLVRWVIGVTLVCSALMAALVLCGVLGKQARPQPSVAKPVDPPAPMPAPSATAAMPAGVVPEQDRDATFMRVLDMKHVHGRRARMFYKLP